MLLHNPENEKQMEILAMDDIMDDSSDENDDDDKIMIKIGDQVVKSTMNTKGMSTPSTCTGMSSSSAGTQQSSGAQSEIIVIDSDSD